MKVRLNISAITRVCYSKEIEVPENTTNTELDNMVNNLYDNTDGLEYHEDFEYWEKGCCYWDKL